MYSALEDWVTDHFLPIFRRTLGGEYRWCAQWWRHGEAISRLTALWHSWEVLRLQPGTGIAVWYRDHLDHQLPILMGARGPFYQCSETAHRDPPHRRSRVGPARLVGRRRRRYRALIAYYGTRRNGQAFITEQPADTSCRAPTPSERGSVSIHIGPSRAAHC